MLQLLGDGSSQLTQYQMWTLIGLGIFGLIYFAVLKPMMRRKDPLEKPSNFASLSQRRTVEREMQNLLVELSEMTRQITAQLDTRAAKLEQLIKDADQRIASLRSAGNGSSPPQQPQAQSQETAELPDPRHADVYALADQGHDVKQIAAELGRPRGEVELILALRSK